MKNFNNWVRAGVKLLVAGGLVVVTMGAASSSQVAVTPISAQGAFSTPSSAGQGPVIDAIKSAHLSIQMWMYSMSNPDVISALQDAANNGVKVEIIMDRGMFKSSNKVPGELRSAGVTVYEATAAFNITHAKTFVIDGSTAYIMSLNLTKNYPVQRDSAIITQDQSLIADLQKLFSTDIENSKSGDNNTSDFSSSALVVSPTNSEDKIVALIQSAQKSIDLTVENLGMKDVISAIEDQANKGVKIRVITPLCDMGNPGYNLPAMHELDNAGIGARMMNYPATATQPYMHQKMIIVDGQRFFIGSENFSENSLAKSREIGVIVNLDDQTRLLQDNFNADWDNASPVPAESELKKCDPIGADGFSDDTLPAGNS